MGHRPMMLKTVQTRGRNLTHGRMLTQGARIATGRPTETAEAAGMPTATETPTGAIARVALGRSDHSFSVRVCLDENPTETIVGVST